MGVGLEERFMDVEEPEVRGEGDGSNDPAVVELVEPFDAPGVDLGVVAVEPCTSSGESN